MKRSLSKDTARRMMFLLLVALAFLPADAAEIAAGNTTGAVSGRVQNVVTGQYLNKARVSVKGTDLVTYSDPLGTYRLVNLPSGPIVLEVFYTDLDAQTIPLDIPAGQSINRDVGLTSVARYGHAMAVVKLDSFVVSSNKETDGEAIAINEKRFSGMKAHGACQPKTISFGGPFCTVVHPGAEPCGYRCTGYRAPPRSPNSLRTAWHASRRDFALGALRCSIYFSEV